MDKAPNLRGRRALVNLFTAAAIGGPAVFATAACGGHSPNIFESAVGVDTVEGLAEEQNEGNCPVGDAVEVRRVTLLLDSSDQIADYYTMMNPGQREGPGFRVQIIKRADDVPVPEVRPDQVGTVTGTIVNTPDCMVQDAHWVQTDGPVSPTTPTTIPTT